MNLRTVSAIVLCVLALRGLGSLVNYFSEKAMMMSPFIPQAVVRQLTLPYFYTAAFCLSMAIVACGIFFMKKYKLTIAICAVALIIQYFISNLELTLDVKL